ncbi:MAG: hypothetical protein R3185_05990, partial [Candidatus Thermoplasmatota archaeon]|nr:hypothetical protein [Candidatus Thermoplasmatota archaeon]
GLFALSGVAMADTEDDTIVNHHIDYDEGFLALNITSPAPLVEVAVHQAGVRNVIFAPYRINTTGWSQGDQDVRVVAKDKLGRTVEARFTVTIDATPPGLDSASADPERPREGEDVTVRMVFDEPVKAASVILVAGDGERFTKPATGDPGTTWEATFAMPDTRISSADIQATDLAGNEALHEAAVPMETDRGIPGPGWLLAALVAGLAALAAIARRER